jgi:DNA polymerase sigma
MSQQRSHISNNFSGYGCFAQYYRYYSSTISITSNRAKRASAEESMAQAWHDSRLARQQHQQQRNNTNLMVV